MMLLDHPITVPTFVPPSAWLRHGPFAMWLVRIARPRLIVELGTHHGFSYFSFCQAVTEAALPTRCIAVDTWEGDEHSGFYGSDVFASVQAENRKYSSFSSLLRKSFSEALAEVPDGSVDILHIDGRHFYADVKEDFENWLPKLSDQAIVLFHDTEVRERDFGVWQYWSELTESYFGFNFPYQHGLGVLFLGARKTSEVAAFQSALKTDFGRGTTICLFQLLGEVVAQSAVGKYSSVNISEFSFDPVLYWKLNPDVQAAGIDPYRHYLQFGIKEGRRIR